MSELAAAIDRDYVDTGNLVRTGVLKGSFVFAYTWILDPIEALPAVDTELVQIDSGIRSGTPERQTYEVLGTGIATHPER